MAPRYFNLYLTFVVNSYRIVTQNEVVGQGNSNPDICEVCGNFPSSEDSDRPLSAQGLFTLAPCIRIQIFLKSDIFSPLSKKYASTRCVFESFWPVYENAKTIEIR